MECPKIKRCRNKTEECKDLRLFGDTYLCFEHTHTTQYEYCKKLIENARAHKRKGKGK